MQILLGKLIAHRAEEKPPFLAPAILGWLPSMSSCVVHNPKLSMESLLWLPGAPQ